MPITRQELKDLKHDAVKYAATGNMEGALRICKAIADKDLFIGESPNHKPVGLVKEITTRYPASCEGCGLDIPLGTEVVWKDNLGCWHKDCQ